MSEEINEFALRKVSFSLLSSKIFFPKRFFCSSRLSIISEIMSGRTSNNLKSLLLILSRVNKGVALKKESLTLILSVGPPGPPEITRP